MLYHIEIEFQDANYETQTRVFNRADSFHYDHSSLDVRQGTRRLHMRDVSRVVRFEAESLSDRLSKDDRDEMDAVCSELCFNKKRIPAIKLVRETLGYGLKESKEYVDARWPYVNPLDKAREINYGDIPF